MLNLERGSNKLILFQGLPRTEAVSIVGSLLPYPSVVSSLPLLMPAADQLSLVSSQDLQDQVGCLNLSNIF